MVVKWVVYGNKDLLSRLCSHILIYKSDIKRKNNKGKTYDHEKDSSSMTCRLQDLLYPRYTKYIGGI